MHFITTWKSYYLLCIIFGMFIYFFKFDSMEQNEPPGRIMDIGHGIVELRSDHITFSHQMSQRSNNIPLKYLKI